MIEVIGIIVGATATLLGLVAGAIVAVGKWRGTSSEVWKEEAEAQKARGDRMAEELSEFREEFNRYRTETSQRIEHLEAENRMLRDLHDNKRDIAELREIVTSGFDRIENHLEGVAND